MIQYSPATQTVYSTGVANSTIVSNGGQQNVGYYDSTEGLVLGGTANGTQILAGGKQVIYQSGVANSAVVFEGGEQQVSSGGVASNTTISNGGQLHVSNGGSATSTIVSDGGHVYVSGGGSTQNMHVSGGVVDVWGSDANTSIYSGVHNVHGEGHAEQVVVFEGEQNVLDGGVATATEVEGTAVQNVSSGGIAVATVFKGGTQNIYEGGSSFDASLGGGDGTINLYEGGVLSNVEGDLLTLNVIGSNTLHGNINVAVGTLNLADGSVNTVTAENLNLGNSGTVNMDVDLQNQTADQLVIESSYSGNNTLALTNVASPTANATSGDGIKLVDFADGATVNGSFNLAGGKWDEGAYEYKLYQGEGSDQDYYLRSQNDDGTGPEYSETFKTMLNVPALNVILAQTGMNSLQRRMGDLRNMGNSNKRNGIWARAYYKDMTVKDLINTDMNLFGAEAGYDWLFNPDDPTKLYAGVMIGYIQADGIKTKKENGAYEKGDGNSPSIGLYATLMNESGWFVDLAARNFWTKLDMTNHSSLGTEFVYKPKRNIFAASAEVGKSIENRISRNDYIRLEPKAELTYMRAGKDSAEVEGTGNEIAYDATNYLNAKAAILLSYNHVFSNGLLIEPLLELAYRYEFAGEGDVSYAGATEKSSLKGSTVEFNAGLNMQLTKDLYWYSVGSYEAGEKLKGWGVHAGVRYMFGEDSGSRVKQQTRSNTANTQNYYTVPQQTTYTQPAQQRTIKTQQTTYVQPTNQTYYMPAQQTTYTQPAQQAVYVQQGQTVVPVQRVMYVQPVQQRTVTTQQTTYTQPAQTRTVTQRTTTTMPERYFVKPGRIMRR